MNRVMLAGHLTRDPVLRKTATGVACADMTVAANENYTGKDGKPQETVCFVDVVAWEKQAENSHEFLKKGSPILIEGKLQYEQWEDKEGQKRNKIRVRADRVQFMGRPPGEASRSEGAPRGRGAEPARSERTRRFQEDA